MEHHLSIWNIQHMHVYTKTPGMCRTFPYISWTKWLCLQIHIFKSSSLEFNIRPALSSCVLCQKYAIFLLEEMTQLSSKDFGGIHIISGTHQKKPWHTSAPTELAVATEENIYRKREGCYNAKNFKSKLHNKLVDNYNSSTEHLWDFVRRFFSVFPVWNNAELVRMIFQFLLSLSLTLSEISSKVETVKVIVWVLGKLETSCGRHH